MQIPLFNARRVIQQRPVALRRPVFPRSQAGLRPLDQAAVAVVREDLVLRAAIRKNGDFQWILLPEN